MSEVFTRKIILENGEEFYGYAFGASREGINELVFNTSMVGYEEIISDPSYTGQIVCMTYPLIGNYGINEEDFEAKNLTMGGLIVAEYNDLPSNFRYTKTLNEVLVEYNIPAISGIDTRKLTRRIRDIGSMCVLITDISTTVEEGLAKISAYEMPTDFVARVTCEKIWKSKTANHRFTVVALDCGIKLNIIRKLNEKGCNVIVVPYDTDEETILSFEPDGLFLSNGPDDPENVYEVVETVRALRGKLPIFGICLGHQIISLAYGAKTYKMKFGHRGANHPVKNLATGKIEITSQNHSYAVDEESLKNTRLQATHINILDNTIEGVRSIEDKIFSVQYHPESAPGPHDSLYLFDEFIDLMKAGEENA